VCLSTSFVHGKFTKKQAKKTQAQTSVVNQKRNEIKLFF